MKPMMMSFGLRRVIPFGAMMLALQCAAALGQSGPADLVRVPPVPSNLEPPAGHRAFLKTSAEGTQNYICLPSGWTFLGPQATLFVSFRWINGEQRQQVATHFLSPNPVEGGTPRPTWQSSLDTSAVWAKVVASSNDPNYVAAGAIPWLLLEVTGAERGPMGGSLLSQATFIQRVKTSGGVTPTTACTVGATAFVPYTTDYDFFKKSR